MKQGMNTFIREISRLISSLIFGVGIVIVLVTGYYVFFGSCGYINAGIALKDMETAYYGFRELEQGARLEMSSTERVSQATVQLITQWKYRVEQIHPPACLQDTKMHLENALENKYKYYYDVSLGFGNGSGNMSFYDEQSESEFKVYQSSAELIRTCIPTCLLENDLRKWVIPIKK